MSRPVLRVIEGWRSFPEPVIEKAAMPIGVVMALSVAGGWAFAVGAAWGAYCVLRVLGMVRP